MRLTYETATATLIQFITIALLNVIDALQTIISTCIHTSGECVSNMVVSVIYYVLIIVWFGTIFALGFTAQQQRSKRFAQILILAELAVLVVAGYNLKLDIARGNHNGLLSLITSLIDVALALWIISLAYHLSRSGGARFVKRSRHRKTIDPPKSL